MKYEDLKQATDRELAERHDALEGTIYHGTSYYLDELRHREVIRALHSIAGVVEHVAHVSLCADVIANYYLARWKTESYGVGLIEEPPKEYLHDHRIKVSK